MSIRPARTLLAPDSERTFAATPRDADGRAVTGDVAFEWRLEGAGTLEPVATNPARARYVAPRAACNSTVCVIATREGRSADAAAAVVVRDDLDADPNAASGVPDPVPIDSPGEPWRSRLVGGEWQYNSGHPDYRLVRGESRRRFRYLALLFAKEVVVRNFGTVADGALLERMVEVLTHVEAADSPSAKDAKDSKKDPGAG